MKARIAFMSKPHDLKIQDVELPALKGNQVLVKVGACGICGSDVHCYEGESDEGRYDIAPYTPGHEWGGEVIEAGPGVTGLKVGDHVTGDCVMACGVCANCKEGLMPSACLNMREAGFRPDSPGGMGTYLIIEEQYTHAIPKDWPIEMGAWVETFSIGYFGIWGNGGYIDASDYCLITGVGPVGISACMVAKTAGAKTIISDPIAQRRERALKYGADVALDPNDPDFEKKLLEATDGHGPSVWAECSGTDGAIQSIFDLAGHSCRVNLVGHSIGRKIPIEIGKVIWKTLKIKGAGGTKDWAQRTIRFMSAIKDTYDFAALTTHRVPFEKLDEAMDTAINNPQEAFKVMLTF
ncbi:MAG: zinc-dependent alcohol dehydrogenase [Christensenellaceae bacterium]|jgi:L-iditol 2-dehydrogenase